MNGWTIVLVGLVGLGAAGVIGWGKLAKEHEEAKNLPIARLDFARLKDGTYHGAYDGGMLKWRVNEADVTVSGGKVTDIQLAATKDPAAKNMQAKELYDRVIKAQSLQVDTITSATLTSKAYLKAVENALQKAL